MLGLDVVAADERTVGEEVKRDLMHPRGTVLGRQCEELLGHRFGAVDLARGDEHMTEPGSRSETCNIRFTGLLPHGQALLVRMTGSEVVAMSVVCPADCLEGERFSLSIPKFTP